MKNNLRLSYRKALRVIDSCENLVHIEVARKFVNNFFRVYAQLTVEVYDGNDVYYADSRLGEMYRSLYLKLDEKQALLI